MNWNITLILLLTFFSGVVIAQEKENEENVLAKTFFDAETVVFLGDSNTYNGQFITVLEACMIANEKTGPTVLNLGLSSETCSGDSEPAHPWPRPNVHERFERVLEKVEPDLIFVNYGMNDGIYHPFDEKRFENYKAGINKIIEAAAQSNGELSVILVTPPPFDPLPSKIKGTLALKDAKEFNWKTIYENYDSEVIAVYSKWILEQKDRVAGCIDLRAPVLAALAEHRKTDPKFRFAHDGVHVDVEGHKVIGNTIAEALDLDVSKTLPKKLAGLLKNRQTLMRDCWLSEVGHKRPGIPKGEPLQKATFSAGKMDSMILKEFQKAMKEVTK